MSKIILWFPHLFQSRIAGKPFTQWAPCYVSESDGELKLVTNLHDIDPSYTFELAKAECIRRNTRSVQNTRQKVADLEEKLAEARADLLEAETAMEHLNNANELTPRG